MTEKGSMPKFRVIRYLFFMIFCLLLTLNFGSSFFKSRTALRSQNRAIIVPGSTWTSVNTGHHIQAHGGGIIKVDEVYYWIGEDKSNGTSFHNINCYSSKDLVQWTYVRALLTKQTEGDLGPDRIVERPKVIFNELTKTFVLYAHVDDRLYKDAKVGVAVSTGGVCDEYNYEGSFRPLDNESRDLGLFKDIDGDAYLLTEDRQSGLHINLLASDYKSVVRRVHTFPEAIESPAMAYLPAARRYIMFGSHLTGWRPNDNVYSSAASLTGPWSAWKTFAQTGSLTYTSQTSYILPLTSRDIAGHTKKSKQAVVWMGDRWDPNNLMRSTYVWLPLDIESRSPTDLHIAMPNVQTWSVDVQTGNWNLPTSSPEQIEAEASELIGDARVVSCDLCKSGKAVRMLQNEGIRIANLKISAAITATIIVDYVQETPAEMQASLTIHDQEPIKISFLPTSGCTTDGSTPGTFSTTVVLTAGFGETSLTLVGSEGFDAIIDKIQLILQ